MFAPAIEFEYKTIREPAPGAGRRIAKKIGALVAQTENRILRYAQKIFKSAAPKDTGRTGRRWVVKRAKVDSIGRVRHGQLFNTHYGAYMLEADPITADGRFPPHRPPAHIGSRLEGWVKRKLGEVVVDSNTLRAYSSSQIAYAIAHTFKQKGAPTSGGLPIPPRHEFSILWESSVAPYIDAEQEKLTGKIRQIIRKELTGK